MSKKRLPDGPTGALADRLRRIAEAKPGAEPPKQSSDEGLQPNDNQAQRYGQLGARISARQPRQPVFKNGAMTWGAERLAVVVRNISSTGARIEFVVRTPLPARALLIVPALNMKRQVRIVWQEDGAAGLEYVWSTAIQNDHLRDDTE